MKIWVLILLSVLLSSGSQIVLKFGMMTPAVQGVLHRGEGPIRIALTIASSPLVLAGLACFGLSAILWLFVLSQISLSSAYPCVALGIVVTAAAGWILLGEPISLMKFMGISAIVAGVFLVAAAS